MSDRRYSTARWQRVRRLILERDGYQCMIRGPRCTGRASTVHHRIPSSQAPHLFWAEENLEAACSRCNYGGGSAIAGANRRTASERIAELEERNYRLEQNIEYLEGRLEELALALQAARDSPTAKAKANGRKPAIR